MSRSDEDFSPVGFVVGLVLGAPLIAYGVWWLFHNARLTNPDGWITTVVAAVLLHDLVAFPTVAAAGLVVARRLPAWLRLPVQTAAILSAVSVLYAYPALGDFGRRPSNPTLLPHDMATNLTIVVAVIWAVAAAWALARRHRRLRERFPPGS